MAESNHSSITYRDAGVDIEAGDRFVDFIKSIKSKSIPGNIGGFSGGFELDVSKYKHPVLLSCTDGVGTKLLVAQKLEKFDTVGIDLVAMSVNDLVVAGAMPIQFLDYIACGKLKPELLQQVMKGIVAGCEQADCILAGGETAEMPDLYKADDFDLAGFAVGIVEKEKMLPKKDAMKAGDIILGIPSAGIHSNGLSLARKAIAESDTNAWNLLLEPTKIYVQEMKPLLETGLILGAAHITGGGLVGNIVRSLPSFLKPRLSWDWQVPEIFSIIQKSGNITDHEMRKVFNMGIGMALIAAAENEKQLKNIAVQSGFGLVKIGDCVDG
ncbi:MAG: phosphoribosylformylglycinamidine cyclo-ligase [Spirochaetales bacterium]|nr:phosphoribosylformylglycinamidine cyclo-ligase [Spirochaetales bacterium]